MEDNKSLLAKAFEAFDIENWTEAERLYRKVIRQTNEQNEDALHMLAFTLAMKGNFPEALSIYEELLKQAQNDSDKAIALHQIGMVYRMEKSYDKALVFFNKEKRLRNTSLKNDIVGFSANFYEFGLISLEKGLLKHAFTYYTQALEYGQEANDPICIACAQRGLGTYFDEIGQSENANRYFTKSISTFSNAGEIRAAEKVRKMLK